jgi:hypothetical protein
MIKSLLPIGFLCLLLSLPRQTKAQGMDDKLSRYNCEMYNFNKKAWFAIGGLSLVGAGVSVPGIILSENVEMKSFHQMNVIYYGLNLAFAIPGYISARKSFNSSYSEKETYISQIRQEKTYLFNAGLDVFYLASGFLVKTVGKNYPDNQEVFNGVGNSLIVQSAFLFAVDATMIILHNRHRKKNFDSMVEWSVGRTGIGLKVKL